PGWVQAGFDEFARRMPRELPLQLIEVKAEPRTSGKTVEAMMTAEAARIEAALPPRCRRVILDEPTTGVDPLARAQFWELIARIRARGTVGPRAGFAPPRRRPVT
ncbi:23S rRNA (pseudouridine(1915)-N(3))-methyltransferase RlmH, partial [Diaphorobacter sp.]|uniref:23S rRNA (pseudouridine(1915)-N(3))-methyltransferase RlmH n=1 Tax=Diaphorobacter sp. TaxID=1934310 RepID=UPI0025896F78